MACIASLSRTRPNMDGCFKTEVQNIIDKIAKENKRTTLWEYYDTAITLYYKNNINKVYLVAIKELTEGHFSVAIYEMETEKELNALLSTYKDVLGYDKIEMKQLKRNVIVGLNKEGVMLK